MATKVHVMQPTLGTKLALGFGCQRSRDDPSPQWFGKIERQAIRRGSFASASDLMAKIRAFINGWNHRKHPFIWTKTPDEILDIINRKRKHVSTTSHWTFVYFIAIRLDEYCCG